MASLVLFVGAALMRLQNDSDDGDGWQSDQTLSKGQYYYNIYNSCTYHNGEAILVSPDDYVRGIRSQLDVDDFQFHTWKIAQYSCVWP